MSTGGGDEDDDIPVMTQTRVNTGYDLNGTIIVAAIVSLSVVLVLIALLHIYARYVLRWLARRRAGIRQLGLMNVMQRRLPKQVLILQFSLLCPSMPIDKTEKCDRESTLMEECTVCLRLLEEGELMRILRNYKHFFHAECVDQWLGSQITCSVCRAEAEPRAQTTLAEAARDTEPTAPVPGRVLRRRNPPLN